MAAPIYFTADMVRALPEDGNRYETVQPDVFVAAIEEARTFDWKHIKTLLLAIEVLSPSTQRYDRFTKRRVYQEFQVASYWMLDIEGRAAEIWTPQATAPAVERERGHRSPRGDRRVALKRGLDSAHSPSVGSANHDAGMLMEEQQEDAMVPGLERRPITMEEYYAYAPEKFELLGGYLFYGPDVPEHRIRLLKLLLVNVGLLDAVRLVPEEHWRAALERVYGSGE